MKFYYFRQNNSGGRFTVNENLHRHVVIEAKDAVEANSLAEGIGIYFNGVEDQIDCDCCGDRWYPVAEYDGENFPHRYGKQIDDKEEDTVIHRYKTEKKLDTI